MLENFISDNRIRTIFVRFSDLFEHLDKKNAFKYLICRRLSYLNIKLCGVNGNLLEHLEGILEVIKQIKNSGLDTIN